MEHQLNLRKLTLNDLNALQTLGKQTYFETFDGTCSDADMQTYLTESFNLAQLEAELAHTDMLFYGAEYQGELIGYLKVNFNEAQTELQDPQAVEIQRIYVLSQYHGKKVGKLLFAKALEIAEKKGANYVWLGVWEHNYKAQQFYQKQGFEVFEQHVFMVGNDPQIDLMMRKFI